MTLLELCEPLFQYVCRLSRSARMGCDPDMGVVRSDLVRIFGEIKAAAAGSIELGTQYERVELPLIFFVDFTIKESRLKFAYEWSEMARDRNELAGDEKFFDLLDAELADPSQAASERLSVYYTCLGLGFTGVYTGQSDTIRRLMSRISARISGMIDADEKSFICPEAYENVDSRDFVEPPGSKLVGIAIALVGLIIVWAVAYFVLFTWTSNDVSRSMDVIMSHDGAAAAQETAGDKGK